MELMSDHGELFALRGVFITFLEGQTPLSSTHIVLSSNGKCTFTLWNHHLGPGRRRVDDWVSSQCILQLLGRGCWDHDDETPHLLFIFINMELVISGPTVSPFPPLGMIAALWGHLQAWRFP